MQVTKSLAELCALLVDDVYGELPSRIFAALMSKGRSSIPQLIQYTSLTTRQLRHGLVVLVQNNLLYWKVESGHAIYAPNVDAAYNIVRIGKILDMIGAVYGEEEKEVTQNLLSMGHAKVEDLRDAYQAKFKQAARLATTVNGDADHDDEDESGEAKKDSKTGLYVKSLEQLDDVLCRLIQAELVVTVTESSFRSLDDKYKALEDEIIKTFFAGGVRGTKGKEDYASRRAKRLREVRDEPLSLKGTLQSKISVSKRRKLSGWSYTNGGGASESDLIIDGDVALRVNYDKCAVELRNQQLTHVVLEVYGETTAEVYATLLQQLSKKISRCRSDPEVDIDDDEEYPHDRRVSTNEVYDNLSPSLDVSAGIGKVGAKATDRKSANQIQEHPPDMKKLPNDEAEVEGEASSDEDEEMEVEEHVAEDDDEGVDLKPVINGANGTKESKVKFNDTGPAKLSRKEHFRQHLLLLCESQHTFLRHCAMEQWTVDFEPLMRGLQQMELDTMIERSVGQTGLRLVRILRRVGKMDEKTLPSLALMSKGEVQKLMLKMQMFGYVDMQEVPRDNNRTASRTLFLYWTDTSRCLDRLLDNTYKAMLRCLQRLEVQREMEREVLDTVKRDDVRGREKELLEGRFYNRFVRISEIQEKLLAQVARLDSLVGTLRDF
ncbi:DNA-directed RNA polymerase III subunit RPC3 [Diaporthe amygdali]|uniref:DNA-directed RNA polymerase III subunit RPC3 n=1 Tax=Phomopsis amygdali TaxID=1214568 RepID=UPI0022FE9802|nr:DNA-directed RNA polymerase III subunit RPC3 [Diaporthe amygdali]KAJ0107273.1 DNA-directed RNA polymerase III subunit RPC3 [Diaporthe amygdali]